MLYSRSYSTLHSWKVFLKWTFSPPLPETNYYKSNSNLGGAALYLLLNGDGREGRCGTVHLCISSLVILKRTDDTFWESDFPYYVGYIWWTVRAMLCWLFDFPKFRLLAVLERMHMPLQLFIGQVRGPNVTRFPIIKKDNQFTLHQMFLICEFQLNIKNTKNWKIIISISILLKQNMLKKEAYISLWTYPLIDFKRILGDK